ncbi:hypothetical protein PSN01_00092 [Micromonospora saelicesensis]|nr:hypothetical protein PSN01_00092 [Micromonospora saelicesensis]
MAPSNHQKHQAGRHPAVAEALLHNHSASLRGPQTFVMINGRTATVEVAAQDGWMVAVIDRMTGMPVDLYVLVDVTRDVGTSTPCPERTCVPGYASDVTSSSRASAAFARATRTAGTPRSARRTQRHGETRWSLFEDAAQPAIGDPAS